MPARLSERRYRKTYSRVSHSDAERILTIGTGPQHLRKKLCPRPYRGGINGEHVREELHMCGDCKGSPPSVSPQSRQPSRVESSARHAPPYVRW